MKISGIVTAVTPSQFTSKAGKRLTKYLVTLDNGTQYDHGFNRPACEPGDTVNFDSEFKYGAEQIVKGSLRSGPAPASPGGGAAPSAPFGGAGRGGREFPVPLMHPDRSIIRQNSLSHAARLVAATYDSEDVVNEDVAEQVIAIARKFEEYSAGDEERRAAETMGE